MNLSHNLITLLKPVHRVSLATWIIMTALHGVFVFLVFFSLGEAEPDLSDAIYLILFLTVLSLSLAAISLSLRWYVTSNYRIRARVADARKIRLSPVSAVSPQDQLADRLYRIHSLQQLVALLLHISITLDGLALSFSFGCPDLVLPYVAFALLLNVVWFPRYRPLVAKIGTHWGAGGKAPDAWSGWQDGI